MRIVVVSSASSTARVSSCAPTPDKMFAPSSFAPLAHGIDEMVDSHPFQRVAEGDLANLEVDTENRLIQVRLGLASALYEALRAKDRTTASHSLRVALTCSKWSSDIGQSNAERDTIEVAALLHDVGKIGIPDHILLKPAPLLPDEVAVMQRHAGMGIAILSACCADEDILRIVRHKATWFAPADPNTSPANPTGMEIPLGARMLAIVDAYDSMTSDRIYRPALSRERAIGELFRAAGSQFDPELVEQFSALDVADRHGYEDAVVRRWLADLDRRERGGLWSRGSVVQASRETGIEQFQQAMLVSMREAVVFVDRGHRILYWNHGAQKLTGITSESIQGRLWAPGVLAMRNEQGAELETTDDPVTIVMETAQTWIQRVMVRGRQGMVPVEVRITPVPDAGGKIQGATLVMADLSSQISLEERCLDLHRIATQDPLTKVANRAEFNRLHEQFIEIHREQSLPCSLIICDLDFFKRVNDVYGHQAGDDALIGFASLLRSSCRSGDLVARYGGEEFVMLCADCNNASAAKRADEIREKWASTPHSSMDYDTVTASFGVTEIQPGDSPETMLRRADRALLQAKSNGRNTVVQLGTGINLHCAAPFAEAPDAVGKDVAVSSGSPFAFWRRGRRAEVPIIEQNLITAVPRSVAIEKLRGFVADHHASMAEMDANHLRMRVGDGARSSMLRRSSDRHVPLVVDLKFSQATMVPSRTSRKVGTSISVSVRPLRARHRRKADIVDVAGRVLVSLRAYLMAVDVSEEDLFAEEQATDGPPEHAGPPPIATDGVPPTSTPGINA